MAMDEEHDRLTLPRAVAVYGEKALAELADAEGRAAEPGERGWSGAPLSRLAFAVSDISADGDGSHPLAGPAGEAADKAATALLAEGERYFVFATQPDASASPSERLRRLRRVLEAADPVAVIALDGGAAADLAAALGTEDLQPGQPVRVLGRVFGAAGDLGASLADPKAKAKVWSAMRAIAREAGLKA